MTTTTQTVVTISYEDLVNFKSQDDNDMNSHILMEQIGSAYGTEGLGILSVSGVPSFAGLRERLLPLAAQIPNLPEDDLSRCVVEEACYSVGWSHGKEELTPGVPDLSKGSYYVNPLVNDLCQATLERERTRKRPSSDQRNPEEEFKRLVQENPAFFAPNVFPESLPDLEGAVADTGQCIANVGCLIARVCQEYCKKHGVTVKLEEILRESLNCKARLLHYFDAKDSPSAKENPGNEKKDETPGDEQWWCGWHNDHGSLTGLVPAMYLSADSQAVLANSPDPKAGLYIQARSKELVKVNLPSDCIGFQIGETFQILSGGLLQATPHAVKQTLTPGVTRETCAVFLEPEYDFPMDIPHGRTVDDCCPKSEVNQFLKLNSIKSRWKPGMTFGEFHNVTVQTFHKQLDNDGE